MNILKYKAYAKINFGLQVLSNRLDGYHNINTVFYLINLFDEIEFSKSDEIQIFTNPNLNIRLEDNLIYKAGKLLLDEHNIISGFTAKINKSIPIGSGLGGGSSNAAITMLALNRLYNLNLSKEELYSLSSRIGSDCVFFASEYKSAIGTGRGEIIDKLDFDLNYKIAIVNPGINISTAIAYKMLNRESGEMERLDYKDLLLNKIDSPMKYKYLIKNDFEDVLYRLHPEIASIKQKLYDLGSVFALMSGSGSTVFALFDNDCNIELLKENFPEYFCYISE